MLIKEIKLENFRSYEFLEMPIKKGLNLIYGSNGSGKSTLSSVIAGKEDYELTDGDIDFVILRQGRFRRSWATSRA